MSCLNAIVCTEVLHGGASCIPSLHRHSIASNHTTPHRLASRARTAKRRRATNTREHLPAGLELRESVPVEQQHEGESRREFCVNGVIVVGTKQSHGLATNTREHLPVGLELLRGIRPTFAEVIRHVLPHFELQSNLPGLLGCFLHPFCFGE